MAHNDRTYSAVVASDGTATVTIATNGVDTWTVSQVSVECPTAPSGSTCSLRKGSYLVSALIPTGDAATGDPPLVLRPQDTAEVAWSGCTPGDACKVFIIYDDGRPS